MDLGTLFEKYGWFVAIVIYLAPKVWQFITVRVYPQQVKERSEDKQAERERQAILLKSQIDRENRITDARLKMEERMVASIEQTHTVMNTIALAVNVGNERIAALIASHTQHANFQFGAHIEIKEKLDDVIDSLAIKQKVESLEKDLRDTQEKIKPARENDDKATDP